MVNFIFKGRKYSISLPELYRTLKILEGGENFGTNA